LGFPTTPRWGFGLNPQAMWVVLSACAQFIAVFLLLHFSNAANFAQSKPRPTTPKSAQASPLAQRAAAARETGQLDEAIKLYAQAVKQKPNWDEGWWALGTLFYELDRYAEGRDAFARLTVLAPKLGSAWAFLGLCEHRLGQYPLALAHLQRGHTLGLPANEEISQVVRYHEAILLTRFEQFELAYNTLIPLVEKTNPNPTVNEALGLALLRLPYLPKETPPEKRELVVKAGRAVSYGIAAQLDLAKKEFQELLAAYPNTSGVHYAYGVWLMKEDPDTSLAEFKRELELTPGHVPARLQIAFEYIKRNQYVDGLKYAEEAVKLEPNSFPARNALGRILLETGDVPGAIRELEAGAKLAPDSPEMHFALARAYSRAGRKAEADKARAEFMRLDKLRRARGEVKQPASEPQAK
jgi:predicted Zn-dependent protease